jgi:hypothetical protein
MRTDALLFKFSTWLAFAAWAVLILFPDWRDGGRVVLFVGVVLLALIYAVLLTRALRQKRVPGAARPGFTTLKGVLALLANPQAALAAWVHILAFDLMVGLYIRSEGAALGFSHWALLPCYLLAMLFGPLGLLLFLGIAQMA